AEVVAEVLVHRERQHVSARVVSVMIARTVEEDELFGILHRKHPQQHLVDQRENRRVGADAERDRDYGDNREERRADQAAPGVAEVACQVTHRLGFGSRLLALGFWLSAKATRRWDVESESPAVKAES